MSKGHGMIEGMKRGNAIPVVFTLAILLVVAGLFIGGYLSSPSGGGSTGASSSTSTGTVIQGVVTGYVTVGPSQPVCRANQSCNVDMTGYSLVFQMCSGISNCQTTKAVLSPSGHYAVLLNPGTHSVTGLDPSCPWVGCSAAFPKSVTVQGGLQLVFNIDIDTGIR